MVPAMRPLLCSAALLLTALAHLPGADLPASAFPLRFTAAEAQGGQASEDRQSVRLLAAADTTQEVRWTFPGTIPAGNWRLTVEFDPQGKGVRNQVLGFVAEHTPLVDCFNVDPKAPRSFVLISTAPATGLLYRKSTQRNQDTLAIRTLTLEPVATPSPEERWCFDCPVVEGRASFPWPLPPGNLRATSSAAATLTWITTGGSFTTPAATRTNVEVSTPLTAITVQGGGPRLTVERHPPVPMPDMPAGDAPLMTTVDPARPETRTLTLVGAATTRPALATFPGGKRQAIFTTWDDGPANDLLVAGLLKERGFRGTFVINRNSAMYAKMAELEGLGMEIGSHSWSHPTYGVSGYARCRAESVQMRRILERDLGHPVISFAYPFGYQPAYDEQGDYVLRSIADAGYWYARATRNGPNRIDSITSPLTLTPDFHFATGGPAIEARFTELTATEGCVFHVWGHSYEVVGPAKDTLVAVLDRLAGRPDTWYATGGQVFVWRWMRQNTVITPAPAAAEGSSFTVTRPWLHPYLATVPMTLRIPDGVEAVVWKGERHAVQQGVVDLAW